MGSCKSHLFSLLLDIYVFTLNTLLLHQWMSSSASPCWMVLDLYDFADGSNIGIFTYYKAKNLQRASLSFPFFNKSKNDWQGAIPFYHLHWHLNVFYIRKFCSGKRMHKNKAAVVAKLWCTNVRTAFDVTMKMLGKRLKNKSTYTVG